MVVSSGAKKIGVGGESDSTVKEGALGIWGELVDDNFNKGFVSVYLNFPVIVRA